MQIRRTQRPPGVNLRRTRTPACLDKEEVLAKLNEVPVFCVANAAEQLMTVASTGTESTTIVWHLDVDEALASLVATKAANPSAGAQLTVAPLGMALTMSTEQSAGPRVRLQPSQAEYNSMRQSLGFPVADGQGDDTAEAEQLIPLFYSDKLQFVDSGGGTMTPYFFGVVDAREAWLESGQAGDLPGLLLTDLRTFAYKSQHDTSEDWQSAVLVPPDASMRYLRSGSS